MLLASSHPKVFHRFVLTTCVLFGLLPAAAQNMTRSHPATSIRRTGPVELGADACFHRLLTNTHVRAFEVEIAPHQATELNHHGHDYLIIALGDNDIAASGPGNQFSMGMQFGEMQVLKGGWPHRIANKADGPARFLELEIMQDIAPERAICGLGASACTDGKFGKTDEGSYSRSTLFDTEKAKLSRIDLGSGGWLPQHGHKGGQVLIGLSELQLEDSVVGGRTEQVQLKPGAVQYYDGNIVHEVKNLSKEPAKFLELELK